MLVLARQRNERIVMPGVPATIEVVAVKPNGVRLGIDAPPEVVILREEVLGRCVPPVRQVSVGPNAEDRLAQARHILRNRLHGVALGLELLRRQSQDCSPPESEAILRRMEDEVRTLDRQLRIVLGVPLDEQLLAADLEQPVLVD